MKEVGKVILRFIPQCQCFADVEDMPYIQKSSYFNEGIEVLLYEGRNPRCTKCAREFLEVIVRE